MKVIFIDDEEPVLRSLNRVFRKEEFQAEYFSNPGAALEVIASVKPEVVVCDILMPEMNGFELLKRVKEISPSTVRVMLSGYPDVSTILHAMNSGEVYRFITKPWKVEEGAKKIIYDALQYAEFLKYQNR